MDSRYWRDGLEERSLDLIEAALMGESGSSWSGCGRFKESYSDLPNTAPEGFQVWKP
jgi:hypothetical protein